jgi:hypothetical protein
MSTWPGCWGREWCKPHCGSEADQRVVKATAGWNIMSQPNISYICSSFTVQWVSWARKSTCCHESIHPQLLLLTVVKRQQKHWTRSGTQGTSPKRRLVSAHVIFVYKLKRFGCCGATCSFARRARYCLDSSTRCREDAKSQLQPGETCFIALELLPNSATHNASPQMQSRCDCCCCCWDCCCDCQVSPACTQQKLAVSKCGGECLSRF